MKRLDVDWDAQPLGQVSDSELARQLGVSTAAVWRARRERGLPIGGDAAKPGKKQSAEHARALELAAEDQELTAAEIAAAVGKHPTMVQRWLAAAGLSRAPGRRPGFDPGGRSWRQGELLAAAASSRRASSTGLYRCIAADPPWPEKGGGRIKRGADRHYDVLSTEQILDVMRGADVWRPDPTGCLLWLWATSNHLTGAIWLMQQLGFRFLTTLVWVKTGGPGLGQRTRQRHELLLLGRMGKVPLPAPASRPDSVIVAPRGRHSEKPAEAYARIERACEGSRLEMFARAARPGWTTWGAEAPDDEEAA